ncbi:MAG: phage tail sheath family protein [Planctomycetes bacterium]|nr:phage tail sheath family protein [Planctomycetota bacterium]
MNEGERRPRSPLSPGIYIEGIPCEPPTIPGIGTSIAAFIGWAARGPTTQAQRVQSFQDFVLHFGGLDRKSWLGYAVQHFFDNGGRDAYVIRLAADDAVLEPDSAAFEDMLVPAGKDGGVYLLDRVDLFNLLCVPGETTPSVVASLQKFCRDRWAFLILDSPADATLASMQSSPDPAVAGDDALNSALYFPWIEAADPLDEHRFRAFPPCGFVAGLYARTDSTWGVWKAPAGTEAGLTGAAGPTIALGDGDCGTLNGRGINCIRTLPACGTVVWGSRTLHGADDRDSEWKYVPVRRLALFIGESLFRGTQWVAFEPNGERLWAKIRRIVESFMDDLFRRGAFQGSSPAEAYFVKCDDETTTVGDIEAGMVSIMIGFAPLEPAEFVVMGIRWGIVQEQG